MLMNPTRRWLLSIILLIGGFATLVGHDHGCLPAAGRRWAVLVIEDHPGMVEAVWDPAFTNPALVGAFRPDHRYAVRTTGTPALIDLGCWDDSFHYSGDHCGEHGDDDDDDRDDHRSSSVVNVSWTGDHKGVILRLSGKATWLPIFGSWDGYKNPPGTFRGAYLNWLLQNRTTTPSIPSETRWQRLQRGANALAVQLMSREGGAPQFRMEGVGSSGRLLIPPAEGLPALQNAIQRMTPASRGYAMREVLDGVVDMARDLKARGGCQPGLVILLSDGWSLQSSCGTGLAYEHTAQYPVIQQQAAAIAATAQASVWTWNVEGAGDWNKVLSAKGMGLTFEGDAIAGLQASSKSWMQAMGQVPQVKLVLDQPALTRNAQVALTITVDRPLSSATLNGKAISITSLVTTLNQPLKEGPNTFTVQVQTPCGSSQATANITLDTTAPKVVLDQVPPALTNQKTLRLSGKVDDPTSKLALNGGPVALDAQGRFAVDVVLSVEGDNPLTFLAQDGSGNQGRLEIHVVRDTLAPVLSLTSPSEGLLTKAPSVDVVGLVDDLHAQVMVNGTSVEVKPNGLFTRSLQLPEGAVEIRITASDLAGNLSTVVRHITIDRTAPKITLDQPLLSPTSRMKLHLSGLVDDPKATLRLNGQPVTLDSAGRFTWDLPLQEGLNAVSFRATDLAGNEGVLEGSVQRDTTAPLITLSSPMEGLRTNATTLQLVGQVDDPAATVTVNGRAVPLTGTTFTFTATPPEGAFSFVVTATDAIGNAATLTRTVMIDRSGPVITLDRVLPALTSQTSLSVSGRVDDVAATLTLNGVAVPTDASGAFSTSATLVEGANTLHFVATDSVGNQSTLNVGVVRDTVAPVISINSPVNGQITNLPSLPVQGSVDDPSAKLTLNGAPLALDAQGRFNSTWSVPLNGVNTLTLQAIDAAGNVATLSLSVLKEVVAPKITITAPAEGLLTRAASVQVEGQVDKPYVQVSVNGVAATLDGSGHYIATVTPSEGSFQIQATVVDQAGNTGSATRMIQVDRTAPVITISPALPAMSKASFLTVAGKVDDPKAALTINGLPASLDVNGAFSLRIPLPVEGTNDIQLQATDAAGNVGSSQASVLRNTTPPKVTIQLPLDGFTTNQHTLTVQGQVDDPTATLVVAGKSVAVGADGFWSAALEPKEGSQLIVAMATDAGGNIGHATIGGLVDWTPPQLTWMAPTPDEGSALGQSTFQVKALVSEPATARLNGVAADVTQSGDISTTGYFVQSQVRLTEGHAELVLEATDRAGNVSSISRHFDVGLTAPKLVIESPVLQADGSVFTRESSVLIQGHIEGPALSVPFGLSVNGNPLALDTQGKFQLPISVGEGSTMLRLEASNRFGQKAAQVLQIKRYTQPFGLQVLWPVDGLATPERSVQVRGRVLREAALVQVNGNQAQVTSDGAFIANVSLAPGDNLITVQGQDALGNQGQAQVKVTCVPPKGATYQWDLPAAGFRSTSRRVSIKGRADLPGIASVAINGQPMNLAGTSSDGHFEGEILLNQVGTTTLVLEARSLAGETFRETRDGVFVPSLPRLRLQAPDSARPGDRIKVVAGPEDGTTLASIDVSFNGRLMARVFPPFAAVDLQIPSDATPGGAYEVTAIGTDTESSTVSARTSIQVFGSGLLMQEVFDDRTGLPLVEATVAVEGGDQVQVDVRGRAALQTALPTSWIKITKPGYTPVWRSAGLKLQGLESVLDARLTPKEATQTLSAAADFAGTALHLSSTGSVSVTPLSSQGMPALLPAGWSPVSAWWIDGDAVHAGVRVDLSLSSVVPSGTILAWVRWDESAHQYTTLQVLSAQPALAGLPVESSGGYAIVAADPGAAAPPAASVGQALQASLSPAWQDGLAASASSTGPSVFGTVEAIRGARMEMRFGLDFQGGAPLPSGVPIQVDLLESYLLVDQRLVEPDSFQQDVFAHRFALTVVEGKPLVEASATGLLIKLPVRMSRTFQEAELVEGRLLLGFYHDGVRVAEGASSLLGTAGGSASRGGVTVSLDAGAVSSPVLVRVIPDAGDPSAYWTDLTNLGAVKASFQVDVVGQLLKGMHLSLDTLDLSDTSHPLVVQQRVIQGQRVSLVVGELRKAARWEFWQPEGAPEVMQGGSFAVVQPVTAVEWVTGHAYAPGTLATSLRSTGNVAANAIKQSRMVKAQMAVGDVPLPDALVKVDNWRAVSDGDGRFAVAAGTSATPRPVFAERTDLALSGQIQSLVPASGIELRLATKPFALAQVLPQEGAQAGPGEVLQVITTTPMDGNALSGVRLFVESATPSIMQTKAPVASAMAATPVAKPKVRQKVGANKNINRTKSSLFLADVPTLVEIPLRKALSQDGRTLLLTPQQALAPGSAFVLKVEGLQSLSGEVAPSLTRRFQVPAQARQNVDFSRIKLSYPDADLNVAIHIPAGAIPAWAMLSLEASEMGAYAQGVMPNSGDLDVVLKASLGERIRISAQLRDGSTQSAVLSCYTGADGRASIGVDGGRVEGPNGLAVVIPEGALDGQAEFKVVPVDHEATPDAGALGAGEAMAKGLQLKSKSAVQFKRQPRMEFPKSALPVDAVLDTNGSNLLNNGPIGLFREEAQTLPDGTSDLAYILTDTAQLSADGSTLVSLGGLRVPDPVQGTAVQMQPLQAKAVKAPLSIQKTSRTLLSSARNAAAPMLAGDEELWGYSLANMFLWTCTPVMPRRDYQAGTVFRNWNGSGRCQGVASATCYGELAKAELHKRKDIGAAGDASRGRLAYGRLLTITDDQGRYLMVDTYKAETEGGLYALGLFAVDPRTGETSLDPDSPSVVQLGLSESRRYNLAITSKASNPFDPTLTAPRIRATLVDANGQAKSLFTLGETATLKIYTEAGSQPVVRGQVNGSITQAIGALPAEIPVTFTQLDRWHVDIQGWSAKPVLGATALDAMVTPAGTLGSSLPGAPVILSRTPAPDEEQVDPSATVKIAFSEPVMVSPLDLKLEVNGQSVTFQVVSQGQAFTSLTKVQEIWLIPDQRLSLGGVVKVTVSGNIQDTDATPSSLGAAAAWSFKVRGADEIGSLAGVGTFLQMVGHKGRLYAVEDLGPAWRYVGADSSTATEVLNDHRATAIRVMDVSDPSQPSQGVLFGQYQGAGTAGYYRHEVRGLRVVPGVPIEGKARDLLIVMSWPWEYIELASWGADGFTSWKSRHASYWAYDITQDGADLVNGEPKLLFAGSLGAVPETYGRTVGGLGGVIGTVRSAAGLTFWDSEKLRSGWLSDTAQLGDELMRKRTANDSGAFPDPTTVVASNGFYDSAVSVHPTVMSAVVTEDDQGKPVAWATMGWKEGMLMFIDGKVGEDVARATFVGGGPFGMDARLTDLSAAVNQERAYLVETIKGTYQGPNGATTGVLLLVASETAGGHHLWVLEPSRGTAGGMGLRPLAQATLQGRISRIMVDGNKMLVGAEVNGRGYVYDLRNLANSPVVLDPLIAFESAGAWEIYQGILYDRTSLGTQTKLRIRNLDGLTLTGWDGTPEPIDPGEAFKGIDDEYDADRLWSKDDANAFSGGTNATQSSIRPLASPAASASSDVIGQAFFAMVKYQDRVENFGKEVVPHVNFFYPELGPRELTFTTLATTPSAKQDLVRAATDQNGRNKWYIKYTIVTSGKDRVPEQLLKVTPLAPSGTGKDDGGKVTLSFKDRDGVSWNNFYEFPAGNIRFLDLKPGASEQTFIENQNKNILLVYSPFRLELSSDMDPSLQDRLLLPSSRSFVTVTFTLYKDSGQEGRGEFESKKDMRFQIKHNASTTLPDVLAGGVWHFQEALAGTSHRDTLANPNAASYTDSVKQAVLQSAGTSVDANIRVPLIGGKKFVPPIVRAVEFTPENQSDVDLVRQGFSGAFPHEVNLGNIQQGLDYILSMFRRRISKNVGGGGHTAMLQAMNMGSRETLSWLKGTGDPLGVFGYQTSNIVNAIQGFEARFDPQGKPRDLDHPENWSIDPGLRPDIRFDASYVEKFERDSYGEVVDSRIAPIIRTKFTIRDPQAGRITLNGENQFFHYYVSYPNLRRLAKAGRYPINLLITRDLLAGSSGEAYDKSQLDASDANLDRPILMEENTKRIAKVDAALTTLVNETRDAGDEGLSPDRADMLSAACIRAMTTQRLLVDVDQTDLYNPGVGILQFLFKKDWKEGITTKTYQQGDYAFNPSYDEDLLWLADKTDPNQMWQPGNLDLKIHQKVADFLLNHIGKTPERLDIMVNGSLNLAEHALDDGKSLLSQGRKLVGRDNGALVILPYNDTARSYNGRMGFSEAWDDISDKRDVMLGMGQEYQDRRTKDPDTLRFIATLRSVVKVLWGSEYEQAWIQAHASDLEQALTLSALPSESADALIASAKKKLLSERQALLLAARQSLWRLRGHSQVMGHSQGGIKLAAAMPRCAWVSVDRVVEGDWLQIVEERKANPDGTISCVLTPKLTIPSSAESMDVAPKFQAQLFADGTFALDWIGHDDKDQFGTAVDISTGENPRATEFRKIVHHINQMDTVGINVGMLDPYAFKKKMPFWNLPKAFKKQYTYKMHNFQTGKDELVPDSTTQGLYFYQQGILFGLASAIEIVAVPDGGYEFRSVFGATLGVRRPFERDHIVIVHPSAAATARINVDEHNFVRAYRQNLDTLPWPFNPTFRPSTSGGYVPAPPQPVKLNVRDLIPYDRSVDFGVLNPWTLTENGLDYQPPIFDLLGRPNYLVFCLDSPKNFYWGLPCPKAKREYRMFNPAVSEWKDPDAKAPQVCH